MGSWAHTCGPISSENKLLVYWLYPHNSMLEKISMNTKDRAWAGELLIYINLYKGWGLRLRHRSVVSSKQQRNCT
jgi:hypothetical protein